MCVAGDNIFEDVSHNALLHEHKSAKFGALLLQCLTECINQVLKSRKARLGTRVPKLRKDSGYDGWPSDSRLVRVGYHHAKEHSCGVFRFLPMHAK